MVRDDALEQDHEFTALRGRKRRQQRVLRRLDAGVPAHQCVRALGRELDHVAPPVGLVAHARDQPSRSRSPSTACRSLRSSHSRRPSSAWLTAPASDKAVSTVKWCLRTPASARASLTRRSPRSATWLVNQLGSVLRRCGESTPKPYRW